MTEIEIAQPLRAVVPGILAWSGKHPKHGTVVHSHFLVEQRTALDPVGADGLIDALETAGGVEHVVLTNRNHQRGSAGIIERFGCDLRVPLPGLREFDDPERPDPVAYAWGDEVVPGVIAHEVGSLAPDDGALEIRVGPGAIAVADAVVRDDGGLGFVPDELMDDPDRTKRGLLEALGRLAELEFDVLLMAHGAPYPSGGRDALRRFIEAPRTASLG